MLTHNYYLYIRETEDSKLDISSSDSVFNSIATMSKEGFAKYCNEKAENFRHSDVGNYDHLSAKQREELARRWEDAANLEAGRYDYYFNLESKQEIFKKSVAKIAKELGMKYKLIIKK